MYHIKCNRCLLVVTHKDVDLLIKKDWYYKRSFCYELSVAIDEQRIEIITFEVHDKMMLEIVKVLTDGDNN